MLGNVTKALITQNPLLAAAAVKFKISQTMILRRLGNKSKIAMDIQNHFPQHKIYIEPFFGAGGMFFNKPKAHHNILNDIDSDVFNLFQVVSNRKNELLDMFLIMPLHMDLYNYWKENKETEPIRKAVRFILLSNYGYMGQCETFRLTATKNEYAEKFELYLSNASKYLFNCQFGNMDFRKFLSSFHFQSDGRNDEDETLIYADPPYLGTNDNYSQSFKEEDANDLFDFLQKTKCKFAYSEFDHPFILEQAGKRGLNVITIGERQNLKNRRTEILVTNYRKPLSLFDGL